MREEETKQIEAMTKSPPPATPKPPQTEKSPPKPKKEKEPTPVEPMDELPISIPGADLTPTPPTATTKESSAETPDAEDTQENEAEEPVIEKQPKTEKPSDLVSDTYNGAVMENYKWSQSMTDLDVRVPVPPGAKARDVKVDIRNDYLRVELLRPERKVGVSL